MKNRTRRRLGLFVLGWIGCFGGAPAAAQSIADSAVPLETLHASARQGDTAWVLTATVLVMLMVAPGLALFYGGLVRRKNVLSIMMQCIFLMGWMSIVWALWGYSLAFGGGTDSGWNHWIGSAEYVGLRNVTSSWHQELGSVVVPLEVGIPRLNHMLFQGMFFVIAPVLLCGAFAERMKFGALVLLATLWGTFVYCPLAHWVWDGGPLDFAAPGALLGGSLDFAGGIVVHASAGISALICALFVGRRLAYRLEPMPPHNLTYTTLGAAMLWAGWLGFNSGNAAFRTGVLSVATAVTATHLSAAAGAIAWAGWECISRGKPTVLGASSGAIAGLVGITPAAGYVHPLPAMMIGLLCGLACSFACTTLKKRLGYDDTLDAFGIHGVGGTLGTLLTALFATRSASLTTDGRPLGLFDGNFILIVAHLVALAITLVLAAVVTFALLRIVDATIGIRVGQESELQGLDVAEHGEEGYIFL